MKLKFKGSAVVPILSVMFLLVISGVTSYVAINRGNFGYVTRATIDQPMCQVMNKSLCDNATKCIWKSGRCQVKTTTPSSTSITSSCFVSTGQCNQRATSTLNCPDGVIACTNGLKCYDSNGFVVTGTKTGKCALNPGQGNESCGARGNSSSCRSTSSSCDGTFISGLCP